MLAADDHQIFLQGLCSLFIQIENYQLIGTCTNGDDLLGLAKSEAPAVVLLDLSMPGPGATALLTELLRINPAVKVVALTLHLDAARAKQLFSLGLAAYVLKESAFHELIIALDTVVHEERYASPALQAAMNGDQAAAEPLTGRELMVLDAVARGMSNKEIARELSISERTVRFHLSNTFSKLDVVSRSSAAAKALSLDLIRI